MLPAMFGSATLATDVSSTSRNVASMTAKAINHGLTLGFHAGVSSVVAVGFDMED